MKKIAKGYKILLFYSLSEKIYQVNGTSQK